MDISKLKVLRNTDLIFNVKEKYFREIERGEKRFEFRECKSYWEKRAKYEYTGIQIRLGYPKSDDESRILRFKWSPPTTTLVDLMGEGVKKVFAFPLKKH